MRIVTALGAALAVAVVCPGTLIAKEPSAGEFQRAVDRAYAQFKDAKEGANADYIPILTTVPR